MNISKANAFPNPVYTTVTYNVELSNKTNLHIRFVDLRGNTIYSKFVNEVSEFTETINLEGLPPDLYLLIIEAASNLKGAYKMIKVLKM